MQIKLIGCVRYSYKGELFEKGYNYEVENAKARVLLTSNDDYGRPYFVPVVDLDSQPRRNDAPEIEVRRKRGRPPKAKAPAVRMGGDTRDIDDGQAPTPPSPIEYDDVALEEVSLEEVNLPRIDRDD